MDFIPRRHQLLPCARFYTANGSICSQQYHLQGSLSSVCTAMSVCFASYLVLSRLVSSSLSIIYNSYSHTNYIHTFVTFIHSYIDTFTYSYTSYTSHHSHMIALVIQNLVSVVSLQFGLYLSLCQAASFYKGTSCIYLLAIKSVIPSVSGPEMSLIISPVDFSKFFMKPSGFWRTLRKPFIKPSGFSQALSKAEWILASLIKSRVDFRKPLIKSRVDSRKPFIKPGGFSQIFIKSRVDSLKSLQSRVDSRKSCTKPSGLWRNLLQNPVDFRQTFISQTNSLQIFFSYQKVSLPVCLVKKCHLSCFKLPFLNNGPLEFTFFILFQAASPIQRITWVYPFYLVSSYQS